MCACIPNGRKNDFRNAEVIAEPCAAPDDEVCPHKDGCQLDLQALHRVRKRLSQAAHQHHQPDSCLPFAQLSGAKLPITAKSE
jgi:hypothetical protein